MACRLGVLKKSQNNLSISIMKNSILIKLISTILIAVFAIYGCEKLATNDWKELKGCPGTPTIEYEGQVYNTVQIGEQCWMAENLNVGSMIRGTIEAKDNTIFEKYCYQNDPSNCNIYGGLYQWGELTQYAESGSYRGICPDGWAIPDENDWNILSEYQEDHSSYKARKLIDASEDYWRESDKYNTGTNTSGFTALPSGKFNPTNVFLDKGYQTLFWTSEQEKAFSIGFSTTAFATTTPSVAISVRCIKKNTPPLINLITNDLIDNFPTNGKIEWNAVDENNNQVYCNLYLKIGNNDFIAPVLENTTQGIFVPDELLSGAKYYWRVMATDNIDTTWSEVRMFRTVSPPCPGISQVYWQGKSYPTVQAGNQCWLRENLNVGEMVLVGQEISNNGIIEKHCYENDPRNCEIYGGMYTWYELMQYSMDEGAQGICPPGWHIPTKAEWKTLISYYSDSHFGDEAGGELKEIGIGHWLEPNTNASNSSGLSFLPGVIDARTNPQYTVFNAQAIYYSSTVNTGWFWDPWRADILNIDFDSGDAWSYELGIDAKLTTPVRCIKNN